MDRNHDGVEDADDGDDDIDDDNDDDNGDNDGDKFKDNEDILGLTIITATVLPNTIDDNCR